MSATRLSLQEYIRTHELSVLKLHLGCGGVRWKDFLNVDLYPVEGSKRDSSRDGCVADVYADMRNLELPENCVDAIFTSHTIEHFNRWETLKMLQDWHRILKPGASLVIETPDFWRIIAWLFHPLKSKRSLARKQFYGNQWDGLDYETHRYVWSLRELRTALQSAGFRGVRAHHRTETHHPGRDMRVWGIK